MRSGSLSSRPRMTRLAGHLAVCLILISNVLSGARPVQASAPFQATFYAIQGHVAQHLVAGTAALWFIDEAQAQFGLVRRFDRQTQTITTAWVPPAFNRLASMGSACLEALAIAPDQALWAADQCDNLIARIDAGNGAVSTFNVGLGRIPTAMTWGPNNHLWLLQEYAGITEFDPATGLSTPHTICPTLCGNSPIFGEPRDSIITGPDGNLWFSDGGFQFVGTMTPLGQVAAYALPAGHTPEQLTTGPDGAIWFTETGTSSLGRVTMSGTVSEFALPASQFAYGIVSAADSHVWYVGGANVGRVDPTTGTVNDFSPLGTIAYNPIAVAADGTIWFAASPNGTLPTILGNLVPAAPPPLNLPVVTGISPNFGPVAGGTSVTITGSNFTGANFVSFRAGSSGLQLCSSSNPNPDCFTVNSDTQITAISPPMDVGAFDVYVANSVGPSAISPADLFTYEGWAAPTPANGGTVTAVMANPPQHTAIIVRLIEAGGPSIAVSGNQSWLSCGPSVLLTPNTAEMDCTANPTDVMQQTLTFTDALSSNRVPVRTVNVAVSHQGYRPNPDGFQFYNPSDKTPSFLEMAADYPGSAIFYQTNPASTVRAAAFYEFFKSWTSIGLCYGMTATSAYYYNDFLGGPFMPYTPLPTADSKLANGMTIKSLVERYYSRQLAEVGAIDAIDQYKQASAAGNPAVFTRLATMVRSGPVTVGIVPPLSLLSKDPARYYDLFNRSHQVVAYDSVQAAGQDPRILVYDPDSPNDANAYIDFTNAGGMKLVGQTSIPYGQGTAGSTLGLDTEWLAVPIRDFTWRGDSSELVALQVIDNQHWILDALAPLAYTVGDIPLAPIPGVDDVFMAASSSQGGPGLVLHGTAGSGFSGPVRSTTTNSVTGEFSSSHVATVTQTDTGAPGSTHGVDINSTASSVHLYNPSSAQQYTVQLGADYLPSYGRRVTVTGLSLSPNTTVDVTTDAAMGGFSVATTGLGQTVTATIEQIGQPASSTMVQVAIPANGQASITVYDWTDLAHSLIYGATQVGGVQTVTILQDNPTQRTATVDSLFQQLTTAVGTISSPSLAQALTVAVQTAQYLYHHGDRKAAALVLVGAERVVGALSGSKITASTATTIIGLSQQIRGLM